MKRVALIAFGAALASAAALCAQATTTAAAPAGPGILVGDTTIREGDSPLVRAAKLAAATRKRESSRSTGIMINDAYLKTHPGGKISEAHSPAASVAPPAPKMTRETDYPIIPAKPAAPPVDRAALAKKEEALRNAQARVAAEMQDPYGGEMQQDGAEARMAQIAKEMEETKQQQKAQQPKGQQPANKKP